MAEIIPLTPKPRPQPEPLWRDALGDRLRRIRHERGERLADTAERAGVSPQYLSEMERGRKEPSSEMIAAVAGALEVTIVELTAGIADDLRARTAERASVGATVHGAVGCRAAFALAA
jgi:transcriptional regulator with XRE-family HTH domain